MSSSSDAYACYYRVYAQRGAALNFHTRPLALLPEVDERSSKAFLRRREFLSK